MSFSCSFYRWSQTNTADLNSACLAAANALQALSHLQPGFASNVSPQLTNCERQQSTNIQSTQQSGASGQVPQKVSSIQSRLQSCFPTIASRQRRSNTVRNGRVTKLKAGTRAGVPGRPKKNDCPQRLGCNSWSRF